MPATVTSEQFVDLVRRSQLVDTARLDAAVNGMADAVRQVPRSVAEELVRQGLLTPYQAGMLLNGKWKGFFVAGGKYKLLQLLGVGGMGKVYLCEHIRLKRLVALKVLTLDPKKDATAIERFSREAIAAAALKSPHIVRAHDIDQDGSLHFLVMEYVDGSSLQEMVKKHGPMEIHRACHYVSQAAIGLQHAHDAGWVHRDIKPGNLLVDRAGTVKILDMGLARFFFESPGTGITENLDNKAIIGTADYLAPEQAVNSHDVDIRADIYSLGGTLYFLLTGHAPFEQGTHAEKLLAHQMKEPAAVTSFRPEVPKPLESVLKKMMAKKPVHRFQTPMAVAEALEPWTSTPVEPPATEEMPRICTALEPYLATGSGPLSGVSQPSSSRISVPRSNPISSSYLLRNGTPNASRWLAQAKRHPGFLAGGVVALLVLIGLTYAFWPKSESKQQPLITANQKQQPPLNPPPPTPPSESVKSVHVPPTGAIGPVEAAKKVGEKVTIEFVVKNTGEARDRSRVFLNSADFREKDNFTVVLDMRKLADDLKAANINDPLNHYKGKVIRGTGTVSLFRDAPQLVIDDLKQLAVVDR